MALSLMRNFKTTTTTQGNVSAAVMLTSFFPYFKGTNRAVLLFPSFFFIPLSPWTPFLFVRLLSSSHPTPHRLLVCKVGFYRSLLESLACSKCPPHSVARQTGATACSCEDGYYKIDSDPPNMACTREEFFYISILLLMVLLLQVQNLNLSRKTSLACHVMF